MRKCYFIILLILLNFNALADIPLVEVINRPGMAQRILPGTNNIVYYSLRNNAPRTFPLTFRFSLKNMQVLTQGNTCGSQILANSTCTVPIMFTAPNIHQKLTATISFDYQGRAPITEQLTYIIDGSLACALLPVDSYQTSFCQTQYQQVLTLSEGLFNPKNIQVIDGQALGGMIGIYHRQQNTDLVCQISCGLKSINGTPPNEQTIFELASVTKTFTGAILGKKVALNQVNPLTSINSSLPPGTWVGRSYNLTANEQPVTFQQLATFSGGVCFSDAPNVNINSGDAALNQSEFIRNINELDPANAICPGGTTSRPRAYPNYPALLPRNNFYSNSSVGLLGQVLMNLDGYLNMDQPDFNGFMCQHILTPLEMTQTNACLPNEILANNCANTGAHCNTTSWPSEEFSAGFTVVNHQFVPGPAFPYVPWAAAGNLRSNSADMIKYVKANLGVYNGSNPDVLSLIAGMRKAHVSNNYLPLPNGAHHLRLNIGSQFPLVGGQGYGWVCKPKENSPDAVCGKIGGHDRFRSFVGFSDSKKYGVVILINSGNGTQGSIIKASIPTPSILGTDLINHYTSSSLGRYLN